LFAPQEMIEIDNYSIGRVHEVLTVRLTKRDVEEVRRIEHDNPLEAHVNEIHVALGSYTRERNASLRG
jgi:hypothetical protein